MKKELLELYRVEDYLESMPDEKALFDSIVENTQKEIDRLEKGKWRKQYYFPILQTEEGKIIEATISVFGRDCKIIVVRTKGNDEPRYEGGDYTPPSNNENKMFMVFEGKYVAIGSLYYFGKYEFPSGVAIEQQIWHKTPIFKECIKDINAYSEKEIQKIRDNLLSKYSGYGLDVIISYIGDDDY